MKASKAPGGVFIALSIFFFPVAPSSWPPRRYWVGGFDSRTSGGNGPPRQDPRKVNRPQRSGRPRRVPPDPN